MLTVDQTLQVIADQARPLPARPFPLAASGQKHVLAQNIAMQEDSPRFDRSQLDGFAVRAADARPGAELQLLGQIDAGGLPFSGTLQVGQCVGINTGGLIPAGADAILMVEQAQRIVRENQAFVVCQTSLAPGYGIQRRGSDAAAGQVILQEGTALGPAQLAACAAAGVTTPMTRSLRIAVLSTGDELVDLHAPGPLPEGKIRNSNQLMLCALALQMGAEVLDLGTAPDEPAPLRAALMRGLVEADLLLVCGGMSMGTRDLVPPMLEELGLVLHVQKVRIKPGKPFIVGTLDAWREGTGGDAELPHRKYVAGLPGNPVSAFVTLQRFVRPLVDRLLGGTSCGLATALAAQALEPNGDREFYQPCTFTQEGPHMIAHTLRWKGSADIFTLSRAEGLVMRLPHAAGVAEGAEVRVIRWGQG